MSKAKKGLLADVSDQFKGLDLKAFEEEPATTPGIQHGAVRDALKLNRSTGDLPLAVIDPDPDQVRTGSTTDEAFAELVGSIKEHGVIQPITVRFLPEKGRFQIVSGERRYHATTKARLETIPVVIRDLDDTEKSVHQLVENLQREDLNPIEEARAFQRYLAATGKTQDQLASEIGKSRPYITNTLSLLERLNRDEQAELSQRSPANMPGKSLIFEALRIDDPKTRLSILRGELTREEARAKVSTFKKKPIGRPKNASRRFNLDQLHAIVTVTFKKSTATEEEYGKAIMEAWHRLEKDRKQ